MIALLLASVWSSVLLSGCSISIVRSALMLSLMMLMNMRGEGVVSLNSVVLAAFVILCLSPHSMMDLDFLLSFLSAFYIIYFFPYFQQDILVRSPRWSSLPLHFLYITLVAQAATAPLVTCGCRCCFC